MRRQGKSDRQAWRVSSFYSLDIRSGWRWSHPDATEGFGACSGLDGGIGEELTIGWSVTLEQIMRTNRGAHLIYRPAAVHVGGAGHGEVVEW